jgi:hypothetical protein
MKKSIVKFIIKLFFFCLPVILLLSFYVAADPFKVLYHYDNYYVSGNKPYVCLNQDYVSTETFITNYPNFEYDSFIFGSSRSGFYQVKDWQKHISSKKCFHFDAAAESLYGINAKLKYLDQRKISIKNVLIILDNDVLAVTGNNEGHLFLKHPELSGQNWFLFQMVFIKSFFNRGFLTEYIHFLLSGEIEKDVNQGGYLVEGTPREYDFLSNECRLNYYENMINKNPNDYYLDKKRQQHNKFFKRSGLLNFYVPVVKDNQKRLLEEIFKILTRNKTVYRIVISPLYNQFEFNPGDYNYLCELFGRKNVYDFSGINEITNNIMNYYDWSHYRPHVAKYILDVIYTGR